MTVKTRGLAPQPGRPRANPTTVPPPFLTPPFPCHRRHRKESNVALSYNDVTTTTGTTIVNPALDYLASLPRQSRIEGPGVTVSPVVEDVDVVDLEPTAATQHLLRLMRTGAIDETIAREMGVSLRTVHRRITRLQNLLGGRSRFQLGVIACERGWV